MSLSASNTAMSPMSPATAIDTRTIMIPTSRREKLCGIGVSPSLTARAFGGGAGVPPSAGRDEGRPGERGRAADALRRSEPLAEDEPRKNDGHHGIQAAEHRDDPTAPRVVAAATKTFAPVSNTPTAATSGSSRRGAVRAVRRQRPR
jgi:hypothetical protein